jgi:hypothetical protein
MLFEMQPHMKKRFNLLTTYVASHLLTVLQDYMCLHQPVDDLLSAESALLNDFNKVVPREGLNGDVVIWLVLMRWRFFLV